MPTHEPSKHVRSHDVACFLRFSYRRTHSTYDSFVMANEIGDHILRGLMLRKISDAGGKTADLYGRLSVERTDALRKLIDSGEEGRVLRLSQIMHRFEKRSLHVPMIHLSPNHERVDIIKHCREETDDTFALALVEAVFDRGSCHGQHVLSLLVS